jgi:hypothetical protein
MTDKDIKDAFQKRHEDEDTGVTELQVERAEDVAADESEDEETTDESTDDDDIPF